MSPVQMIVGSSLSVESRRISCSTSQPYSSSRPRRRSMISSSVLAELPPLASVVVGTSATAWSSFATKSWTSESER
jgi:hypothetical protein